MLGEERDFVVDPANPHGHRPVVRLEKIDADNRGGLEGDPNLDFPVAFFDTLDCPPGDTCPIGQLLNRKLAPLAAKPDQLDPMIWQWVAVASLGKHAIIWTFAPIWPDQRLKVYA